MAAYGTVRSFAEILGEEKSGQPARSNLGRRKAGGCSFDGYRGHRRDSGRSSCLISECTRQLGPGAMAFVISQCHHEQSPNGFKSRLDRCYGPHHERKSRRLPRPGKCRYWRDRCFSHRPARSSAGFSRRAVSVGITGTGAAIAHAVFHATGTRIRNLRFLRTSCGRSAARINPCTSPLKATPLTGYTMDLIFVERSPG